MHISKVLIASIFMLSFVFSCKNEKTAESAKPVLLTKDSLKKSAGTDCDKPDSLRLNCLQIDLSWPKIEGDNAALKTNVATWANAFFVGMMSMEADSSILATMTTEGAMENFMKYHAEFSKEAPDSPMGQWSAECMDTVLQNDGQYLTLELNGYSYAGGAHGNPSATVATFETSTGKMLTWDDLVTDQAAMKALAEKRIRVEWAEAFNDGFTFDETFTFALPTNFGLTKEGIYCHYVPYEIGPYALGSAVFTIPFAEISTISKIKK